MSGNKGPGVRRINFFRPARGFMAGEVRVIGFVLAGWLLAIAGSQAVIWFVERSSMSELFSTRTLFNLPVHFWFTGHFLPLWFIILCVIFNYYMDRHASRKLEGSMRFRVGPGDGED